MNKYFQFILIISFTLSTIKLNCQIVTKNDSDIFSKEKKIFYYKNSNFSRNIKTIVNNNYNNKKDIEKLKNFIEGEGDMPEVFYFNYLKQYSSELMPIFSNHNNYPFRLYILGLLDLDKKTKDSLLKNPNLPIAVKARLGDKKAEKQIIDAFDFAIYQTDTLYTETEIKYYIIDLLYVGSEKCMQHYVKGLESTKEIVYRYFWERPYKLEYDIVPISFVLLNWYKEAFILESIWPFSKIFDLWIHYTNSMCTEYINTDKMEQLYKEATVYLNKKYNVKIKMNTNLFRILVNFEDAWPYSEEKLVKILKSRQPQK